MTITMTIGNVQNLTRADSDFDERSGSDISHTQNGTPP